MKINLHSHTSFSDGANTVREMAEAARAAGHCAYVSSDHDYMTDLDKYERSVAEARLASEEMGFPIFTGLEISICGEEANLIGEEACRAWHRERMNHPSRDDYRIGFGLRGDYYQIAYAAQVPSLRKVMAEHDCGLVLVHPGGRNKNFPCYDLFHGFEIYNSGAYWGDEEVARLSALMPKARHFKGMDAHSVRWYEPDRPMGLLIACNDISFIPQTEKELIHWIKTGTAP